MLKQIGVTVILFAFFSCGNREQPPGGTMPAAPAPSDLMQDEPVYNPEKIDPKAAVVTIVLKATGNSMAEMQYDQKELHVLSGSTVKLEFINDGKDNTMLHNFVLILEGTADTVARAGLAAGPDKNYVPAMRQVLVSTRLLQPESRTELFFPAPEKGVYDFICTYPGHYQKMNGKFYVD